LISTTLSMMCWCASATDEKSASPLGWKKQSTTALPPFAGRLIGRHSVPNSSRIASTTP